MNKLEKLFLYSLLGGVILSIIILFMPTSIYDFYPNAEVYDTGFHYYLWKFRAIDQSIVARVTAWVFFFAHLSTVLYLLKKLKKYQFEKKDGYTRFNVYLLVTNACFILLHYVHTWLWYDALAQDTPVWSSQGSVIIILVLILIIENQRRGLFFGKKIPVPQESKKAIMKYHGIYIVLATIFTFWYHPMENTVWHVIGFFYLYLLFIQLSFTRTRLHQNKYYIVTLEVMVLIHGTIVALYSNNAPWSMFLFGFATIFFITQIYGIGLHKRVIHALQGIFVFIALVTYSKIFNDRQFFEINEMFRIPFIEYTLVFVFIYVIYAWKKIPLKPWVQKTIKVIVIVVFFLYSALTIYTMSSYHPEPEMRDYILETTGLERFETRGSIGYEYENYDTNIIMIPGGKVMPEAYEYLAYNIASQGYKVTIVKTPFQLAILHPFQASSYYEEGKINVIMGHSLGGVVASMNASRLDYDQLIIMGSYPIGDIGDTETILLVGSKENLLSNETYYENTEDLTNATEHIIPGGNHAYFGFYGEQKGDNPALYSNKYIQDYVSNYILSVLE